MNLHSFEKINYAIRPNKNIERKIIFDTLREFPVDRFDWTKYRYIGFGAPWFSDFRLAHQVLSIEDLVSIENKPEAGARLEFNKPYHCVRIEIGESTVVLNELDLSAKRSVVWLDYDTGLEGPIFQDTQIILGKCRVGTMIFVTVNARRERLIEGRAENSVEAKVEGALKKIADRYIMFPLTEEQCTEAGVTEVIASAIIAQMKDAIRISGRKEKFVPLFNFRYNDGTEMVSVGGVIGDIDMAGITEDLIASQRLPGIMGEVQYKIAVPHLTPKEKWCIDQLLPVAGRDVGKEIEEHLGFVLRHEQVDAYCQFYRQYPLFGEIDP